MNVVSYFDFIVSFFLFVIFYFYASSRKNLHIENEPYYKYFVSGLFFKILGGFGLCMVYLFYYDGGDTLAYFHDNTCIARLFLQDPIAALQFTFFSPDDQLYNTFDNDTGYPYFFFDGHAVYVVKITWMLSLITFNSYIGQTMILSFLSFLASWRLYKMFIAEFPMLQKGMAYAILFVPSVIFWGSGLLKDTITLAALALFTSSFYEIIKKKSKYFLNITIIILASWAMIKIKPYIFIALLPGVSVWFSRYKLEKMKNKLIRSVVTPLLLLITILFAFLFLGNMSESLGEYSISTVVDRAIVSQQELKQDYYHGSAFDIGEIDPSLIGILKKAPVAITAALFRPFLWESYNPAMIVSGIENFIILAFTLYLLFKLRVYNLFKLVFKHSILFFSVSFSLFFAFSVGLSTSNFGALVRYKIPAIPFFVASLIITNYYYLEMKKEKLAKEA